MSQCHAIFFSNRFQKHHPGNTSVQSFRIFPNLNLFIRFGCGVALAGLAAECIGYETTVTDCLPGHLKNLARHPAAATGQLQAGQAIEICVSR